MAHCFGCGRLNPDGYRLRTLWDGEEIPTQFTPSAHQTAIPGYVYGGLIAFLIDCHGTGTAAAAMIRQAGRKIGDGPAPRFVTASLRVDFLRPTPLGPELLVRGRPTEIGRRKVVVAAEISAGG